MKKITIINYIMALFVILTVWVPYTRIFLLDIKLGNTSVVVISFVLCISSLMSYKKDKNKINLLFFIIGTSPLIFILIILFLVYIDAIPLAP